jgi:hypothetical protein
LRRAMGSRKDFLDLCFFLISLCLEMIEIFFEYSVLWSCGES